MIYQVAGLARRNGLNSVHDVTSPAVRELSVAPRSTAGPRSNHGVQVSDFYPARGPPVTSIVSVT